MCHFNGFGLFWQCFVCFAFFNDCMGAEWPSHKTKVWKAPLLPELASLKSNALTHLTDFYVLGIWYLGWYIWFLDDIF